MTISHYVWYSYRIKTLAFKRSRSTTPTKDIIMLNLLIIRGSSKQQKKSFFLLSLKKGLVIFQLILTGCTILSPG